jgi:hypothetical protein
MDESEDEEDNAMDEEDPEHLPFDPKTIEVRFSFLSFFSPLYCKLFSKNERIFSILKRILYFII